MSIGLQSACKSVDKSIGEENSAFFMEQLLWYEGWTMCTVARQLQLRNTARGEITQFCLFPLVSHYTIHLLKKRETTISINMYAA